MKRRTTVAFIAGTCLLGPVAARAQPAGTVPRIGVLITTDPIAQGYPDILRAGLRDLGWVDGKNVLIEVRRVDANPRRQRDVAAELKALPVAMIVAFATALIAAARDGAPGLPIVMVNAGEPVGSGFVKSLARPGGNLTGTTAAGDEVLPKQLELLSTAVPHVKRVSVLMNGTNPANPVFFGAMSARASTLGLTLERIDVTVEGELDAAIARAAGGALLVVNDPMFVDRRARIVDRALRLKVPTSFGRREYVEDGGLMSYVSTNTWHWRTAATFVDKILKGAKPADIPVERPTMFDLLINLKTAKALGLTIPPSLLQRADEVIR